MPQPELVIFDCDGVLVDTEATSARVMTRAINAVGWPITNDEARRAFHGQTLGMVATTIERQIGRSLPAGWLRDFEEQRNQVFRQDGVAAIDGAAQAVSDLQRHGIEVCVASQASLEKTRLTLKLTGLLDLFEPGRLFSAAMVEHGKPAPDLFLHAARVCGHRPSSCTVVEDSVLGVAGARAAGMRVLGYAADSDPDLLADAGAEVFVDLRELRARIGANARRTS